MGDRSGVQIAVVDYGLGNLFSIKHACELSGMGAEITSSKRTILESDGVILPGVGAFEDAVKSLRRLGLIDSVYETVESGKPLMGICLGLQLLFSRSYEFGRHEGLGIIKGEVVRLDEPRGVKVPQVGWNRVCEANGTGGAKVPSRWKNTLMEEIRDGSYMYFVHSYYGIPEDPAVILATTNYGKTRFCSAVRSANVYAFQFHPERSGTIGLRVYRNLHTVIRNQKGVPA